MKIKQLDQRCGDCGVVEYCGNPFGFCLCDDEFFGEIEEKEYKKIADSATGIKPLDACVGCYRPDCGIYRYSATDFAGEDCEHNDDARDYYCEQIAGFVKSAVKGVTTDEVCNV
jgi:hypothetical protein